MGWGSGTANFPYLISPNTALKAQAAEDGSKYANVSDNYDFAAVTAAVTGADVAIVFANADSGEDYITVDGNQGDRNNLTLWGNGDALIAHVASINPNTIVVLHTVGAVIVEAYKQHPNITAILWAGLPGQESGNAITDVLYGKVNPQAKSGMYYLSSPSLPLKSQPLTFENSLHMGQTTHRLGRRRYLFLPYRSTPTQFQRRCLHRLSPFRRCQYRALLRIRLRTFIHHL